MKPYPSAEKAYRLAHEHYLELGIDTERSLERLDQVVLSIPCWQADDISGFEVHAGGASGGIQVTGNYPGKANNIDELRSDLAFVLSMLPGGHRVNLHSIYGDFGQKVVERDEFNIGHFRSWIDWAKEQGSGIDFNATCFGHPKAGGLTLSNPDEGIRKYWIRHVQACREITAELGRAFGRPSVHNLWIPDGSKDTPVEKLAWREFLKESLDEIFARRYPGDLMKDSVESKLFGIGSEAMTVGSHEFYLAYAIRNHLMICLDNGHFHPTEQVADKISALLPFTEGILLHMTRGIRWDSDHVVTLNDDIIQIAQEIVRCNALNRVFLGLDFFDASINRTGALITGARAVLKAFLIALLEPVDRLADYERNGRLFERLALLEELKSMPFGAVWDYYCVTRGVPPSFHYVKEIEKYEKEVLLKRPS
jgi:L-rhamnose isomerase